LSEELKMFPLFNLATSSFAPLQQFNIIHGIFYIK
jgi:hypothetical protein